MDTTCDICGSPDVQHVKCKVICRHCGTILQSCADLAMAVARQAGLTRRAGDAPAR